MKKTSTETTTEPNDAMLSEYRFDYRKARPNRFAGQGQGAPGRRLVVLDPDIANVFTTPEQVNAVLRALIATMPQSGRS